MDTLMINAFQKFCKECSYRYNIDIDTLLTLGFEKFIGKKIITLINVPYIYDEDGIFAKIENGQIDPLTKQDAQKCINAGYKVLKCKN